MSELQRRSDGACETKDGMFAVKLRVVSGINDGMKWFEFKSTMLGPVTRIEWPEHAPFALLPQEEAKTLVRSGYAMSISDGEMNAYNKALRAGQPAPAPTIQPEVQAPPAKPDKTPEWLNPTATTPPPPGTLPQAKPDALTSPPVTTSPLKPIAPSQ